MVEFTLVFLLVTALLFTLFDLGLLLNVKLAMSAAARAGARRAAIEGGETPAVLETIRLNLAVGGIPHQQAEVEIRPRRASYGTPITVTIIYTHQMVTPLAALVLGNGVRLEAEAVSRSEKVRGS
ncbi:MAG: TadE/TadG family type IV pilus assembly protein [Bacillota bacterium]